MRAFLLALYRFVISTVGVVVALTACVGAMSTFGARAQPLPDDAARIQLRTACQNDGALRALYLLQWLTESRPLSAEERARLPDLHRDAYRLFEQIYRPYRDPRQTSTWTDEKPMAAIQPFLVIDIAPDTTFARWEREDYAFDLNWHRPPIVRTDTIHAFRPQAPRAPETLLYAVDTYREDVIEYFLPPGAAITDAVLARRIDCLDDALGLIDWVRSSRRMHSPPHITVTMNQRRDRAVVAYGWGMSGGIWVAYRRAGDIWHRIQALGRWQY